MTGNAIHNFRRLCVQDVELGEARWPYGSHNSINPFQFVLIGETPDSWDACPSLSSGQVESFDDELGAFRRRSLGFNDRTIAGAAFTLLGTAENRSK